MYTVKNPRFSQTLLFLQALGEQTYASFNVQLDEMPIRISSLSAENGYRKTNSHAFGSAFPTLWYSR